MMDITRLNLAEVLAPSGHPRAGEVVPVYGFVIKYERGIVVVDTGVGSGNSAIEHLYRPVRRPLVDALADFNIRPSDVTVVINSHLHFDHCGENNLFPDRPIFVQAREYDDARGSLYTVVDWVDFRGANYEL